MLPFEGHWIQDCPTNNDRDYDNRPRIKRTTGIPRSFLKAVENPTTGNLGHGVMVTPEGGYVVAQPDSCVPSITLHICSSPVQFLFQGVVAETSVETKGIERGRYTRAKTIRSVARVSHRQCIVPRRCQDSVLWHVVLRGMYPDLSA